MSANPVFLQQKSRDSKLVNLQIGKEMPSSADVEAAVLGALLIDPKAVDECLRLVKTEDVFHDYKHRLIFQAVQALYDEDQVIDLVTLSSKLRSMNALVTVGGDVSLISLTQKISSSAHIEYHCRLLMQYYIKRFVIRQASSAIAEAYDDDKDSLELLSDWSSALDLVTEISMQGKKMISYGEGLDLVEKRIEFLTSKAPEQITGQSTGFAVLNKFTSGWQGGELIVIGARPGMGKTALVLAKAIANARDGHGVGIISAEMSSYQLIARTVAVDTDFHLTQITKTGFEKKDYFVTLAKHKHRMKGYPIYIDDTPSPDIRSVIATARMWKRKYDIKILIVDYLQLLSDATKTSRNGNREQEISSISRKLKALAKELNVPVIALSQLSREVETRGDKRPKLSDLRESGAIEQDADVVAFIYRAEYYGIDVDPDIASLNANTEFIIAKYRGGAPNTTIGLKWIGDKTKFVDPEEDAVKHQMVDSHDVHHGALPVGSPETSFADDNIPF